MKSRNYESQKNDVKKYNRTPLMRWIWSCRNYKISLNIR